MSYLYLLAVKRRLPPADGESHHRIGDWQCVAGGEQRTEDMDADFADLAARDDVHSVALVSGAEGKVYYLWAFAGCEQFGVVTDPLFGGPGCHEHWAKLRGQYADAVAAYNRRVLSGEIDGEIVLGGQSE